MISDLLAIVVLLVCWYFVIGGVYGMFCTMFDGKSDYNKGDIDGD